MPEVCILSLPTLYFAEGFHLSTTLLCNPASPLIRLRLLGCDELSLHLFQSSVFCSRRPKPDSELPGEREAAKTTMSPLAPMFGPHD